ncbi:hypothetical protein C8Q76DRAFT_414549 [Earliella scabrosa]|nr:hypothetical protein C8Q76DRAFT_414549 [Earliella scabrosa]
MLDLIGDLGLLNMELCYLSDVVIIHRATRVAHYMTVREVPKGCTNFVNDGCEGTHHRPVLIGRGAKLPEENAHLEHMNARLIVCAHRPGSKSTRMADVTAGPLARHASFPSNMCLPCFSLNGSDGVGLIDRGCL